MEAGGGRVAVRRRCAPSSTACSTACGPRRAALTLALFFGCCTVAYGSFTVLGDLYPVFLSWGYTFGLIALAAMVGAIVIYAADREPGPGERVAGGARRAGARCCTRGTGSCWRSCSCSPRPGVWRQGDRAGLRMLLAALGGDRRSCSLYYWLLGRSDLSWKLARGASKHAFADLADRSSTSRRSRSPRCSRSAGARPDFLDLAMRAWPVATLVEWALSSTVLGATPLHAFQGVTIPLAVLAVEGVRGPRWALGLAAPGPSAARRGAGAWRRSPGRCSRCAPSAELAAPTLDNANFITAGERDALDYLDHDPTPGGVVTRSYLGAVVPVADRAGMCSSATVCGHSPGA